MRKIINILMATTFGLLTTLMMMSIPARALVLQDQCSESGSSSEICASEDAGGDVTEIIGTITDVMFFFVGALAVVMIIYSGIRYTTSAGNANSVTAAKNTLIYSVVGLIVAILAYAIVKFIITQLG